MKKLAIIGASYLQLPLVKKAKEAGIETHCFAWLDGAVCKDVADFFYPISIVDKEAILAECRKIGIDGITTIASDTAVVTVNYVARCLGLISNPDSDTEVTTNKYKMRERFLSHGVPSPKFTLVGKDGFYDISAFKFPLIIKPTDRSGSRGVSLVTKRSDVADAVTRAVDVSFSREAIIEEYVSGREISVEAISYQGKHFVLQITDKVTTGAPYFVEIEHHQPSSLPLDIIEKVKKLVIGALDALNIKYGASHSEIKITDDNEIVFIEIGARMGGDFIGSDLVELSTGYDFLLGVIMCALGKFDEPRLKEHYHSGVYFLSEGTKYLSGIIDNWRSFPEVVKAETTDQILRKIEYSGDRSGYLIYKADYKFIPRI